MDINKKNRPLWQKGKITCSNWNIFSKDKSDLIGKLTLDDVEAYFVGSETICYNNGTSSHVRYLFYIPTYKDRYVRIGDITVFTPNI